MSKADTAVAEGESTEVTWRGISPKHMVDEYVTLGFVFTLLAGVTLLPLLSPNVLPSVVTWIALGLVVTIAVVNFILIPFRVRAMRYWLRDDDFVFRRGVIFQRQVAVPYGRLQLVDINRGPLSRLLGLAEIRLVTAAASSGVTIPGIVMADSEALRDELVALAESRRAGL
ncbi:PH domain-containing protein [Pontimonas sp.]|uniref:PH domain-containing protein n=1 Tax=Pontimonas sp. TaxID=2304492 RepID=UPI0028703AD9|nr:PH domain-containing protein [Pontimonas sp.]MDR9434756.1 PH domain-containing protein [Pontimonas sp.]